MANEDDEHKLKSRKWINSIVPRFKLFRCVYILAIEATMWGHLRNGPAGRDIIARAGGNAKTVYDMFTEYKNSNKKAYNNFIEEHMGAILQTDFDDCLKGVMERIGLLDVINGTNAYSKLTNTQLYQLKASIKNDGEHAQQSKEQLEGFKKWKSRMKIRYNQKIDEFKDQIIAGIFV